MLDRLDIVRKVGLFDDYIHLPECSFGEVTLIFGENGTGKSTIAAILDSLRECNPAEILRRKSLPGDASSFITVVLDGELYIFDGAQWDRQPPYDTLEVFFPGFVSRNVHATNGVDPEQRRNLCEFVLGRAAVGKVASLIEADEGARAALAEKKQVEGDIRLLVKPPDTLDTYLALPKNASIDVELEGARLMLKRAHDKNAILARPNPVTVELPRIDPEEIAEVLQRTTDGVGQDIASVLREHIQQHLDAEGENWLNYGSRHMGAGLCPFCGQDLAGSELAAAIQSYFGAEYRAYADALSSDIRDLRQRFGPAAFLPTRASLASQVAIASPWEEPDSNEQVRLTTLIGEAEDAWRLGASALDELLRSKQTRPLEGIESDEAKVSLDELQIALNAAAKVNALLSAAGKRAEVEKTTLMTTEISAVEEQVHRLENQASRYEPLAEDLVSRREAAMTRRNDLLQQKATLKEEIDQHASRVVGKYQKAINHYLEYFGCDIRIEAIEAGFPSGRASVQYKLKAHGHEIPLGCSDDCPCFETVLSEGDKYTLALSFFFARLKDREDLSGRIVVLDDPVNSLGGFRRGLVEAVIRDLRLRKAQVVVLTHDERLAALIWRDRKLGVGAYLQVQRSDKSSQLRSWDVEKATQTEYVKDYLCLSDYLECGGDHEHAARSIRPYVEQRLRHQYPGPPFRTRDSLGQMIATIRQSEPGSRVHVLTDKLTDLDAINDATKPSHHASDDVPGWESLSAEEVRIFARKALQLLG
jgi:wobble nucleotide-excising tRNase